MFDFESWQALSEETHSDCIGTSAGALKIPRILVLQAYNRIPVGKVRFSRRNIYARDNSTCQYCGKTGSHAEFNLDHVIPRSHGGKTTWENVVAACSKCNVRKGSKLLSQLPKEMKLKRMPYVPAWEELQAKARKFPPKIVHTDWVDFVGVPGQEHGRATDDEQLDLDLGNDWGI